LHPIPVSRPFQIWGVDVMEFPTRRRHNHYVIVFQDMLSLVFAVLDQKAVRITKLLAEQFILSLPSARELVYRLFKDDTRSIIIVKLTKENGGLDTSLVST